jgi:hypothetical protein
VKMDRESSGLVPDLDAAHRFLWVHKKSVQNYTFRLIFVMEPCYIVPVLSLR